MAGEVILKSGELMSVLRDDVIDEQWMVISKVMSPNGSMKSWFKSRFLNSGNFKFTEFALVCIFGKWQKLLKMKAR